MITVGDGTMGVRGNGAGLVERGPSGILPVIWNRLDAAGHGDLVHRQFGSAA
jgi:hypothetical protein